MANVVLCRPSGALLAAFAEIAPSAVADNRGVLSVTTASLPYETRRVTGETIVSVQGTYKS